MHENDEPSEKEIEERLARVEGEIESARNQVKQALDATSDAPGANWAIASILEKMGQQAPPNVASDVPTQGQIEAMEGERDALKEELARLRGTSSEKA